jgi:hypothetical protein
LHALEPREKWCRWRGRKRGDGGARDFLSWHGGESSGSAASHGGDGLRRFMRQHSGKVRVRSGPINDAVHKRAKLTG